MWKRSFIATTVALGDTVDDALTAIESGSPSTELDELVRGLRAPQRATRAAALAQSVRDIVVAIDEGALR